MSLAILRQSRHSPRLLAMPHSCIGSLVVRAFVTIAPHNLGNLQAHGFGYFLTGELNGRCGRATEQVMLTCWKCAGSLPTTPHWHSDTSRSFPHLRTESHHWTRMGLWSDCKQRAFPHHALSPRSCLLTWQLRDGRVLFDVVCRVSCVKYTDGAQ